MQNNLVKGILVLYELCMMSNSIYLTNYSDTKN